MASFPPSPPLPAEMPEKKRRRDKGPAEGDEAGPSTVATAPPPSLPHERTTSVRGQPQSWWEQCCQPDFPEEEFRRAFRMGRKTFDMIYEELRPVVEKENTPGRDAIPARQRVAVCIWRLATGEPYTTVSKRFGIGSTTCRSIILDVCSAINTFLMPKFLCWPADANSVARIKARFESLSGIPNIIGSMYTTHIAIIKPDEDPDSYLNHRHTNHKQKASYSTIIQGVVDPDGIFTDASMAWPGSMSDDQVLKRSMLCLRASAGALNNSWVIGGSGYPLMDWVLVPYTHQNLTWTQHAFNEKIKEVQRVGREAFARLKKRWSWLQKRFEVKQEDMGVLISACLVLHNICEMNKEEMDPELQCDLCDDELVAKNGQHSISMMQARDNIANNLLL